MLQTSDLVIILPAERKNFDGLDLGMFSGLSWPPLILHMVSDSAITLPAEWIYSADLDSAMFSGRSCSFRFPGDCLPTVRGYLGAEGLQGGSHRTNGNTWDDVREGSAQWVLHSDALSGSCLCLYLWGVCEVVAGRAHETSAVRIVCLHFGWLWVLRHVIGLGIFVGFCGSMYVIR